MLEHVTHEITISALPTAIPESIPADVSGDGDRRHASAQRPDRARGRRVLPRRGPERRRDHDRHPLAAAGRGGARARARGGGRAGRRGGRADRGARGRGGRGRPRPAARPATPATPATPRSSPEPVRSPASERREQATAFLVDRPRQPGSALRAHPPQRRLPGRRGARAPLGPAEGEGEVPRPDRRGPHPPRRSAGRAADPADLHERVRRLGRARRAAQLRDPARAA